MGIWGKCMHSEVPRPSFEARACTPKHTQAASLLLPPATPLAVAAAALAANGLAFLAVWTAPFPAGVEEVALGPCEPRNANKCGVTLSLAMCTAGTYLTKHRAKYQAPPKKRDTLGFRAIKEEKWAMQNFSRVKNEERRITIDSSSTGTSAWRLP